MEEHNRRIKERQEQSPEGQGITPPPYLEQQFDDPASSANQRKTDVPIQPIWGLPPVHEYPERHVHPTVYVHPEQVVMPGTRTSEGPKTIPESSQKEFPEQFGKNSPKNSDEELIPNSLPPTESKPVAGITSYKKKGKVGRQRKYEELGNNGEIPVKEVVLFRHVKGRHWPGMSQDMREWYEFYYFRKPVRTERAKDAEDYTRHVKSWERGQRWIAEYEASQGRQYQAPSLGNSGKIVAYRKRAN